MRTLTQGLGIVFLLLLFVEPALAEEVAAATSVGEGMKFLGLGIAVLGAALGQGKIMASALDSMGRNPGAAGQMFVPWFLGLVFIEALFVLCLLVAAGYL